MTHLQQVIDLSTGINFKKVVSRPLNPFACDILQTPLADSRIYSKTIGEEFSYYNLVVISGDFYDDMDLVEKEMAIIANKSKTSLEFLLAEVRQAELCGEKLLAWSSDLKNHSYNFNDLRLVKTIMEEYVNISNDFMPYMIFTLSAGTYLENEIKLKLKTIISHESKLDELVISLTLPERPNLQSLEQRDFYKLIDTNQLSHMDLQNHLQKYAHIGYRWGAGQSWTESDLNERISSTKNARKILENLEENERNAQQKSNALLNEIRADESLRALVDLAKQYVWLRTYRSDTISFSLAYLGEILDVFYINNGCDHDDYKFLTLDEIQHGILVDNEEVNRRKLSFAVVFVNGNKFYLAGDDSIEYKNFLDSKKPMKTTIIGTVANRPIKELIGKVRLIMDPSQISDVRDGEILVTSMTTPNYIQAMHKAAGFITDEGGILCHAAILSRELNKPCIVGTENATSLLKTGDFIYMDLLTGEVTKL